MPSGRRGTESHRQRRQRCSGVPSFYATKNMTTGEGGMVTTSSPELCDRMRIFCLHGSQRDAWARTRARAAGDTTSSSADSSTT